MTDHKAESQRRAVLAKDTGDLVEAVLAVNEATLYLAEQQRIANLVKFLESEVRLLPTSNAYNDELLDSIRTQITNGLGL